MRKPKRRSDSDPPPPPVAGEIVRTTPERPQDRTTADLIGAFARCAAVAAELARRGGPLAMVAFRFVAKLWRVP